MTQDPQKSKKLYLLCFGIAGRQGSKEGDVSIRLNCHKKKYYPGTLPQSSSLRKEGGNGNFYIKTPR
jgi:hypothetical protein